MSKEDTHVERIPYAVWSSNQMSVAKHYGGININGMYYVLDYDNCPTKGEGENMKYFPDLVLFSSLPKKKSSKKSNQKKPINLLSLFPIPNE